MGRIIIRKRGVKEEFSLKVHPEGHQSLFYTPFVENRIDLSPIDSDSALDYTVKGPSKSGDRLDLLTLIGEESPSSAGQDAG